LLLPSVQKNFDLIMTINANTKIAAILKHKPDALEAIIGISSKFQKLRNPVLRKLLAARTTISMASKIGKCSEDDFFSKLKPLGFEINHIASTVDEEKKQKPDFILSIPKEQIVVFDVRPIIASGGDPLKIINEKIKNLQHKQVLKIVNTFEPVPLMQLLQKKGFESYADVIEDNLVETYFYKNSETKIQSEDQEVAELSKNWDETFLKFKNNIQTIDVRSLEMPLPMLTILDALDKLPAETALYVYHKRIPVFLLPELSERKFDYRIKEISAGEVHLLIFRK